MPKVFPSCHGCCFLSWKPHPSHFCFEMVVSWADKGVQCCQLACRPSCPPCCCRHLSKRGERCGWRDAGLGQLQSCMPEGRIRLPRPEWLRAGCWEQYFRPHRCTDIISALFGTTFMIRVLLQGLHCKEWDLQITSGRGSLLESCSFCLFWLTDSAFRGHLGWIDMFSFSVCAAVQGSCRLQ